MESNKIFAFGFFYGINRPELTSFVVNPPPPFFWKINIFIYKNIIMKKVIRLTERDLIRLVKKVINEDTMSSGLNYEKINKNSLITFLSYLNCGDRNRKEWKIDESGSNYNDAFLLPKNFFNREEYPKVKNALDLGCIVYGKKLFWSLYLNNNKQKYTSFYIEMLGGALHYTWNSEFNRGYEKLEGNELKAVNLMKKLQNSI